MAVSGCLYGAPGEIRTPDLVVRSHALYPTELRARVGITEDGRFYHAKLERQDGLYKSSSAWKLAERVGFEPTMELSTPYSLSRGAPSAARPPLLNNHQFNYECSQNSDEHLDTS